MTQVTDYLFEDPWTYGITNALVKKNYARVSRAVFFLRFISSLTIYHSTAKILGVQRKNIKSIQLNILRSSVLQMPWRVDTIFSVHIRLVPVFTPLIRLVDDLRRHCPTSPPLPKELHCPGLHANHYTVGSISIPLLWYRASVIIVYLQNILHMLSVD